MTLAITSRASFGAGHATCHRVTAEKQDVASMSPTPTYTGPVASTVTASCSGDSVSMSMHTRGDASDAVTGDTTAHTRHTAGDSTCGVAAALHTRQRDSDAAVVSIATVDTATTTAAHRVTRATPTHTHSHAPECLHATVTAATHARPSADSRV
jgi:hypothetical protein